MRRERVRRNNFYKYMAEQTKEKFLKVSIVGDFTNVSIQNLNSIELAGIIEYLKMQSRLRFIDQQRTTIDKIAQEQEEVNKQDKQTD